MGNSKEELDNAIFKVCSSFTEEVLKLKQENQRLQEKYDCWHSKCNENYKENKHLKETVEYVNKAIYTQYATMNHMDNTDYERGQISGLIIASNIIRKAFSQI